MIYNKSCPASLIAVETSLKYQKQDKRADIVVYDNLANPLLVVECKASNVKMTQKVFDQIAMYNLHFKAKYLAVTNGMEHFFCKMDYANKSYSFIKELPEYEELKK